MNQPCQDCKQPFLIDEQDQAFYTKMNVPHPTFCYPCRLRRKMVWRNEVNLYKKEDCKTGKLIFSMYPPTSYTPVMDVDDWYGDSWDKYATGREYDFSKPFFEQLLDLLKVAPVASRSVMNIVNSDYCNNTAGMVNCYLCFGGLDVEDSLYSVNSNKVQELVDCLTVQNSQVTYGCVMSSGMHKARFAHFSENCSDVWFVEDCSNCQDCLGCVGLKNARYCIFNKQYTKEEYEKKYKDYQLDTHEGLERFKKEFAAFRLTRPFKYVRGKSNSDVSGEYISNSSNVHDSYYINDGENLRYCHSLYSATSKDSYDHYRMGKNSELVYESLICGINTAKVKFSSNCFSNCSNIEYSIFCTSSSNLFGCVGLHSAEYCILNKQYTKEEYEALVPKIIEHMNTMPYTSTRGHVYRYGEFFPEELSPLAYNESIATEVFPLSKDEAESRGYRWTPEEKRAYEPTVQAPDLPNAIGDVTDDITKAIIACSNRGQKHYCKGAFQIIAKELEFYRKIGAPLPRTCYMCRYYDRVAAMNSFQLYDRTCQCAGNADATNSYRNTISHPHGVSSCNVAFRTSYEPTRKEILYCEACYNAEVA